MRENLTVGEGIQLQQNDLKFWKVRIKKECYKHVKNVLDKHNRKLTKNSTGYDVIWGQDVGSMVRGWKPKAATND